MAKTMSVPAIGTGNGHKFIIFFRVLIFLTAIGGVNIALADNLQHGPTLLLQAEKIYNSAKQLDSVRQIETAHRSVKGTKTEHGNKSISNIGRHIRETERIKDRPSSTTLSTSVMFNHYHRITIADKETFQEFDTDFSAKAGPDDQINLHSGEVVFSESDINLPQRGGIGFTFTRTYRSQIIYQGPLGRNWDHNHNQRLIKDADGNLDWLTGQRRIRFTRKGNEWYAKGAFYKVSERPTDPNSGNQAVGIEILSPKQTRYYFEPAKQSTRGEEHFRIKEISSPHRDWTLNALKYVYHDGMDVLRSVTDPFGNKIDFFYNTQGYLKSFLFENYIVEFQYNDKTNTLSEARIPQVAIAPPGVGNKNSTNLISRYKYQTNEDGAEITNEDTGAWIKAITQRSANSTTTFDYDLSPESADFARVVLCQQQIGRRERWWERPPLDSESHQGEGIKKGADLKSVVTPTWKLEYEFNRAENQHKVTVQPPTPSPTMEYIFKNLARHGNKPERLHEQQRVPSRNASWLYEFNKDGLLLSLTQPLKAETRYSYDSDNAARELQANLLKKQELGAPQTDNARSSTSPEPKFAAHVCKEFGTEWKYAKSSASFPVQEESYEILEGGQKKELLKTTFEYDSNYDLIKSYVGDSKQITQWTRNKYGLPLVECDALGACNYYEYEQSQAEDENVPVAQRGGLLSLSRQDADPKDITRQLEAANIPLRLVERTISIPPPVNDESRYEYDPYGNIETVSEPDGEVTYANNKLGMPLASLDTRTDLTLTEFNDQLLPSKRWKRIAYPDASANDAEPDSKQTGNETSNFLCLLPQQAEYETLYKGKPLGNYGNFYSESFEYDFLGWMVTWTQSDEKFQNSSTPDTKDSPTVNFEWFPNGSLKRRILPSGLAIEHRYENGQLTSQLLVDTTSDKDEPEELKLKSDITYDKDGFLKSYRGDNDAVYQFIPDAFGRNFGVRQPDKTVTLLFLDGLGRVAVSRTFENSAPRSQLLIEREYQFDSAGNPTTTKVRRMGPVPSADRQNGLQLAKPDKILVEQKLEYDEAGNIIKRQSGFRRDAHTRITYDGLGRPVVVITPERDANITIYENRQPVFQDALFKAIEPAKSQRLGQMSLYDGVHRYAAFPVDTDGKPRPERGAFMVHDSQGRKIQQTQPQKAATILGHDSRDNLVLNKTLALARADNSSSTDLDSLPPPAPITYEHRFDVNAQLISTTLHNKPISFKRLQPKPGTNGSSSIDKFTLEGGDGNQTTTYVYDNFGRLQITRLPDDLERETEWNDASLPTRISWKDGSGFVQPLEFEFDVMRRLTAIAPELDDKYKTQEFTYDLFGNLVVATDRGNKEFPVQTVRQFDNLGTLLSEETSFRDKENEQNADPNFQNATCNFKTINDLEAGQRVIKISGLKKEHEKLWNQIRLTSDRQGRITNTQVNRITNTQVNSINTKQLQEVCHYTYTGGQVRQRDFPQGKVLESVALSPLLEPIEFTFQDKAAKKGLCEIKYAIGPTGQVIGSSLDVPSKRIKRSTFYQYDAFNRLTGEVTKDRLFDPLENEHQNVFAKDFYWRARRFTYDQAGNRSRSFRQRTNDNRPAADAIPLKKSTWQWYSSGTPWNSPKWKLKVALFGIVKYWEKTANTQGRTGNLKQCRSNRLGSIWGEGEKETERTFDYDGFGRLTKFPSVKDGKKIEWEIKYDPLWRVRQMSFDHDGRSMILDFATDAFNRRVLKQVKENKAETRREVTSYLDRNPNVVKSRDRSSRSKWDVRTQYLWGARDKELLMSWLPRSEMGETEENGYERYFFHQDRGLNVFMATLPLENKVEILDVASYLGFGENSTQGQIKKILPGGEVREVPDTKKSHAYDKTVGDNPYSFRVEGRGWIAIQIAGSSSGTDSELDQLNIWTDSFPETFDVYVVDDGNFKELTEQLDGEETDNCKQWKVEEVKNSKYSEGYRKREKSPVMHDPYNIPLAGKTGSWIVIAWPNITKSVRIEEIEVIVRPRHPTSIAFAGSWLDRETGLYCYGVRYRLPSMGGKFISPDPLGYAAGHNLYAYGYNDPLTWHDPNGEIAQVVAGGAIGGILGGGAYGLQVWMSGEEFSWAKLAIYTGAGAASGSLAAATFGASMALTAGTSLTPLTTAVIASSTAGLVGGAAHGAIATGGVSYLETGDLTASLKAGGRASLIEGGLGVLGGAVGGAVFSKLGGGLLSAVASGASGGAVSGGTSGAISGYQRTGTFSGASWAMLRGARRGAVVGGIIGGAAWGVGHASGKIRKLPDQPDGLPDMRREGLLVRTKPGPRKYHGIARPGYAAHHRKPLSLGGVDDVSNIQLVPNEHHFGTGNRHPGPVVDNSPYGTIFY